MLLELAIGDAVGIAFEFVKDPSAHGLVNDLTYQQNPRYLDLKPSQYTDDTLRSIMTARLVIDHRDDGLLFNPTTYADSLAVITQEDDRKGWSKNFQRYLEQGHDTPVDFLRGLTKRAESNGSIMGCLPLAYLDNLVDIRLAATAQAVATHSVTTAPYAQAMALAAHYFLNDLGSMRDLHDFLVEEAEGWQQLRDILARFPVDMSAQSTAHAVLLLLDEATTGNSLTAILKEAINIGGDTDSVAALALGIGSCCKEIENDLPEHLIEQLDHGRGAEKLRLLEGRLTQKS